ncbi:MAG: hypothetical protein GY755_22045 [Chloroflexi bacterium]|nr:hypothetical protein [Chloroflexota bacterium]
MPPRPLELFDLPKLPRYRDKVLMLDSRRALTRGNPLRAVSFLAYLNPTRRIYTGILESDEGEIVGSITQHTEENFARLSYLTPADIPTEAPLALVENLTSQAGLWQAHHIVAEIDENAPLFTSLRQSGFSVYSRQHIWDLSEVSIPKEPSLSWRKSKAEDLISIQSLHRKIVPPLLQQVDSFTRPSAGMIYERDELLTYIEVRYGTHGIFLRPLIHPNTDNIAEKLLRLLAKLNNKRGLPVYLCVRSYQAWIEPMLEEMGAKSGQRQAVMVKHLVNKIREEKTLPAGAEKAWANPAATIKRLDLGE